MSGPVLDSASGGSVWGSATGALFSWEPFDFGLRDATVASAEAAVARARAGRRSDAPRRRDRGRRGVSGYRRRAQRAVEALQADLERRDLLSRAVHTLVENQLRPGAEASRSDAERAAAQTRLIQAQQNVTLAQIALARVLGVTTGLVTIDATTLLNRLPADASATAAADHASAGAGSPGRLSTSLARRRRSCREPICRACISSPACSRAGVARTRTGNSTAASQASVSNARTGRPACRWSSRTPSTSRVFARARRPPRRPPARRPRCSMRRC